MYGWRHEWSRENQQHCLNPTKVGLVQAASAPGLSPADYYVPRLDSDNMTASVGRLEELCKKHVRRV